MPNITLNYGFQELSFGYDTKQFQILDARSFLPPLSDELIGQKLDGTDTDHSLEDFTAQGQSALIVVPDATRESGSAQIVNLLARRIINLGIQPSDIRIIFATGIHRKVTEPEKESILTRFIYQRIRSFDHDPYNLLQMLLVGRTASGVDVELNRALFEHDLVFVIGAVNFHYFAGFTGGRKLICPGLASARTILATHRLAFNCDTLERQTGVGPALLDGNVISETFLQAASFVPRVYSINTIVNGFGECVDLYCGDLRQAHEEACRAYDHLRSVLIEERRDVVIASCGGMPYDVNLIQAHKSLDVASRACNEGGSIILLAECSEGFGNPDMYKWFGYGSSKEIAVRLCEKYQVNGQTAWSIRRLAERYRILLFSSLDRSTTHSLGFSKVDADEIERILTSSHSSGYILPRAALINVKSPPDQVGRGEMPDGQGSRN
jgi:nickel-dependent lactate racemase